MTYTLYVPYCTPCAAKRRRASSVRLRTALIMGAVGFAAGGLLKGLGAAAGGALGGFFLAYLLMHAILRASLEAPVEIDENGRPKFRNAEYQLLFDRKNPA